MTTFSENFESMNFEKIENGCYHYSDKYSEAKYMELITKHNEIEIPILALFTKNINSIPKDDDILDGFKYICPVTQQYQFIGNDVLCDTIRTSIIESCQVIFEECPCLSYGLTKFSNEIIIQNVSTVNNNKVGIIRPQINISNSYNRTERARVSFGFSVYDTNKNRTGFTFTHKLISMSQVHKQSAKTSMSSIIGNYVDMFADNISTLIKHNFETIIDEEDVFKILGMIEKSNLGKNRFSSINEYISSLNNKSAWNIFHILIRFSTDEKNLNMKRIIENVAESVLVIPYELLNTVENFNKKIKEGE